MLNERQGLGVLSSLRLARVHRCRRHEAPSFLCSWHLELS